MIHGTVKMTMMKKLSFFAACLGSGALISAVLSSCDAIRMPPASAGNAAAAAVADKASVPAKKLPRHALDGRRIALYAGADYTSKAPFEALEIEYGLTHEGGMLFYPANLTEAASDTELTAVITLGSPERTVRGLENLRSARSELSIISIFPADEVLAVEAVSDLVIDIPASSSLMADETASSAFAVSDRDLSYILLAAALFAEQRRDLAPLARFDLALEAVRKEMRDPIAGRDWNISQYIDTDSGLKARNHLVIDTSGGSAQ